MSDIYQRQPMNPCYTFCNFLLQKDAEDSLAEALPALEAARIALEDLDKGDVTEIRSVQYNYRAIP